MEKDGELIRGGESWGSPVNMTAEGGGGPRRNGIKHSRFVVCISFTAEAAARPTCFNQTSETPRTGTKNYGEMPWRNFSARGGSQAQKIWTPVKTMTAFDVVHTLI